MFKNILALSTNVMKRLVAQIKSSLVLKNFSLKIKQLGKKVEIKEVFKVTILI